MEKFERVSAQRIALISKNGIMDPLSTKVTEMAELITFNLCLYNKWNIREKTTQAAFNST